MCINVYTYDIMYIYAYICICMYMHIYIYITGLGHHKAMAAAVVHPGGDIKGDSDRRSLLRI